MREDMIDGIEVLIVSPVEYNDLWRDSFFLRNSIYLRKIDYNPDFGDSNVKDKISKKIYDLIGKPYLLQTYEPLCKLPDAVGMYKGREVIVEEL